LGYRAQKPSILRWKHQPQQRLPAPASVQQAVMDAVRDKPVVARPSSHEPRFSLTVNDAKASEVFMGW